MQPGNPDIREAVEKNRGLLKKIQLHIPIFSGYRKLEDIRVADELLRKQMSQILQQAIESIKAEREALVSENKFDKIVMFEDIISRLQEFQGELLHAQQGSTGISPSIRLDEGKLEQLYTYDLKFLDVSDKIKKMSSLGDSQNIDSSLQEIRSAVSDAKTSWEERIQAVENILLTAGGGK